MQNLQGYEIWIKQYDDLLLNDTKENRTLFRINGMEEGIQSYKTRVVLALIRHGVEDILHWTPNDVINHMTPAIARSLAWDMLFRRYFQDAGTARFQLGLEQIDYRYVMSLCYPDIVVYDRSKEVVDAFKKREFQKKINSEKSTNLDPSRMIKNYVLSKDLVENKADVENEFFRLFVATYVIPEIRVNGHYSSYGRAHDLYAFFANDMRVWQLLGKAGLAAVFEPHYKGDAFRLLVNKYYLLGIEDSPFWRNVYRFDILKTNAEARIKADSRKNSRKSE